MAKRDLTEAEFKAKEADLKVLAEHTKKSVDSGLITEKQAIGIWAKEVADLIGDN